MSSTAQQIPEIVSELKSYFGTHVTKTYAWRHSQLLALQRLLADNEDAIQEAVAKDLRKPNLEGRFAEVWGVQAEVKLILSNLKTWMKPTHVATPVALLPGHSYIVHEPYGCVLIISPFNYPVQLALMPLAVAIAGGNVAVIKPSELTPASSALLAKLIPKYFDPRAFRVVEGAVPETTALLKEKWDLIFFTGSEMVGKIVQKAAAEHLTPTVLELGGKSPTIVTSDADIDLAVRRTVWGKFMNAGQTCIAPDFVYVDQRVKQEFMDKAKAQIAKFYGSNPRDSKDLARIVAERHVERLGKIIDAHRNDLICGGEYDVKTKYVAPTLVDVKDINTAASMKEEIFGPILPIVSYNSLGEVKKYINEHPKPLALYCFTSNKDIVSEIQDETSSGGVVINDTVMHFTNPNLPFGGVGSSGLGSYHGKFGFEAFTHKKPVLYKSVYGDAPIRYAPYTAGAEKMMKTFSAIGVDSDTFSNAFKYVGLPLAAAGIAHYMGVRVSIWMQ